MSLLRKASFGRRPSSRAQAPEAEAEAEEAQADAEGPKKGIGRLLRSASFERRSRRGKADAGANGAPGATDEPRVVALSPSEHRRRLSTGSCVAGC